MRKLQSVFQKSMKPVWLLSIMIGLATSGCSGPCRAPFLLPTSSAVPVGFSETPVCAHSSTSVAVAVNAYVDFDNRFWSSPSYKVTLCGVGDRIELLSDVTARYVTAVGAEFTLTRPFVQFGGVCG